MKRVLHFGGRHGRTPVIGATAALNGLALDPHQTWAFRRAELAAFSESPFRLPDGSRATMAYVRSLPPRSFGTTRLMAIATRLLDPMLLSLRGHVEPNRVGLAVCLPERLTEGSRGRYRVERFMFEQFAEQGLSPLVQVEARGHASAAPALQWAAVALAEKRLDAVVVGGVDSYYDPDVFDALVATKRIFTGDSPDGFIPGEGGAFFVLTTGAYARSQGWPSRATLLGASIDEEELTMETGLSMGLGLTRAVGPIAERLRGEGRSVGAWLSDMTNEPYRTHELSLTIPRVGDVLGDGAEVAHLPPFLGDLGAATLPTGIVLTTEALLRGDPPADPTLLTATSQGVDRGAVLVGAAPAGS